MVRDPETGIHLARLTGDLTSKCTNNLQSLVFEEGPMRSLYYPHRPLNVSNPSPTDSKTTPSSFQMTRYHKEPLTMSFGCDSSESSCHLLSQSALYRGQEQFGGSLFIPNVIPFHHHPDAPRLDKRLFIPS